MLFTSGYVAMFFGFVALHVMNKYMNQVALTLLGLMLGICGGMIMINYTTQTHSLSDLSIHRYFSGFILCSLSFAIGRPAILKQLAKSTPHPMTHLALTECLSSLFGLTWGISSLIHYESLLITMLLPVTLLAIMLVIVILNIDTLAVPHWAY